MLSYKATRGGMRILELESRCAVIRTVGSNPTLSVIFETYFSGLRAAVRRRPDVFQPSISFDA
jgi:hypothetical protein